MSDGLHRPPWEIEADAMIERMQEPGSAEAARRAFETQPRVNLPGPARLHRLHQRAVEVFGTAAAADHWLDTPCDALENALPRRVAKLDEAGTAAVERVLNSLRL